MILMIKVVVFIIFDNRVYLGIVFVRVCCCVCDRNYKFCSCDEGYVVRVLNRIRDFIEKGDDKEG